MSGNERPIKAPKNIALMIGINNLLPTIPQGQKHLEELVAYLRRAYPLTHIVLMALLPVAWRTDLANYNQKLRAIAQRQGITFLECGQAMDPNDKKLYSDGLHPVAAGHEIVLPCLKAAVQPYV